MFESIASPAGRPWLQWRTWKVKHGEPIKGYIAGTMIGLWTHGKGRRTQPCVHRMTAGAVQCQCQTEILSTRWTGYLPILTTKRRQIVIIVSATTGREIQFSAFGDAVEIAKGPHVTDRVKVTKIPDYLAAGTWADFAGQRAAADIRRYLLTLWGNEDLRKHFEEPRPAIEPPQPGKPGRPRKNKGG